MFETCSRCHVQEYFTRLEGEATTMLQTRFSPPLAAAGIEHELLLLRLKVGCSIAYAYSSTRVVEG